MGGKSKRRKTKRTEGSSQGPQSPTKQSFKKERTKTRDAKLHRMGDGGEAEEEEADTVPIALNNVSEASQHTANSSSQEEEKSSNAQDENAIKSAAVKCDTMPVDKTHDLSQKQIKSSSETTNKTEDPPPMTHSTDVTLTNLDKDSNLLIPDELRLITSEEALKKELREATEEEYPPAEDLQSEIIYNMQNTVAQEIVKRSTLQKSTQTDPVHITSIEKPVKFFISDDSDSDTAIFVDASQGASNGIYGRTYGNMGEYSLSEDRVSAVIDVSNGSGAKVTGEEESVKPGIQNDIESYTEINSDTEEGIDALDNGNSHKTHFETELRESENFCTEQKTRCWQHMSQSEESQTQEVELREGKMTFSYDSLPDQYDVRHSSASDISDKCSQSKSCSNMGDQVDSNMSSIREMMAKGKEKKLQSENPIHLDNSNLKSTSESGRKNAYKNYIGESFEDEYDKKTLKNSSNKELIDKGSSLESLKADTMSRTQVNEFEEHETEDENFSRKYESVDGIARIFASDPGEPDSTSRSSISESEHFYGTSRISTQDSVDESNKVSASATGSSSSINGDYMPSKSSVFYSSEFDVESLSSIADHLPSNEETLNDLKAKHRFQELEGGDDSPTGTKYNQEANKFHPSTPAWEELSEDDRKQLKKEGIYRRFPLRNDKSETEGDAESLFFSLYPEYSPGEHDELQDATSSDKKDNPNVLCFRGQATGRKENEEEVYMATEKSKEFKVREGRSKGPNTGKTHEFQQKLTKQKKSKRKIKEINEHEGLGQQEYGSSTKEQPNTPMQRPQGASKTPGFGNSVASHRWETSLDVHDNSSNSYTTTTDTTETKYTFCTETDNMVCQSGQLRKQAQKLISIDDFAIETTVDEVHVEENPYEVVESPTSLTEVAEEVFEVENKTETNPKDRKTFVGIAKDWIKGVTGLGVRRDDTSDKNEKDEGKTEVDFKTVSGSSQYSEKDQLKERSNFEGIKETDNFKEPEAVEETTIASAKGNQKRERIVCARGTDSDIKDEDLFEPEDDLSDSVFKDDSWKGRDSDDNEVQDTKTEDSWVGSQDDEFMFEMIDSVPEQETHLDNTEGIIQSGKVDKTLTSIKDVTDKYEEEKQEKISDGKEFRQHYGKPKSPSLYKEEKKGETGKRSLQRDREGRGGSKKRRQRRRTKSYEDSVDEKISSQQETDKSSPSREPRPEEVALPADGFENETTPEPQSNVNKNFEYDERKPYKKEGTKERKRSFRKSCKDKKYARKDDTKSEVNEQNTYVKEKGEDLTEMKEGQPKIEKSNEDTYQISEDIASPQEKSQRQGKVQSPFTAPAATWSPRVGRREWKNNRKSNGDTQDFQSGNESKTVVEIKAESNHDNDLDQTLQMQLSKSKSRQTGLSLTITKIREDTPIPSPKTTHYDFEEHSSQDSNAQEVTCDQMPLLQALTFPPGVSMPLSPKRPIKELKFPLGILKPLSPVPGPKFVPGFTCKLTPPYLGFQEVYFEATSPLPESVLQSNPMTVSFSNAQKPLSYPARPVSPLKEIVFPEGITRPVSPQPRKAEISNFSTSSALPKISSPLSCNEGIYDYSPSPDSPIVKSDHEVSPSSSPILRKERPRLIIPRPKSPTDQALSSPEPIKPTSPLIVELPEGTLNSLSLTTLTYQLSSVIQDSENEAVNSQHIKPSKKPTNINLQMKFSAKPVSPLRSITFPEGISEPLSPDPKNVFLWPFRPSISKHMSKDEKNLHNGNDVVCETEEPQTEISVTNESSLSDSRDSESHQTLLKEFTFPEGISKPASPNKCYFSNIFIKMTQPLTKLVSPSNKICNSPSVSEDLPLISSDSTELEKKDIQSTPTPNSFIQSDHADETFPSQLKTETSSDEDLNGSEKNKLIYPVTTQTSPSKSVSSPEAMPDSQPSEQKEFSEPKISEASPHENYTETGSSQYTFTTKPKISGVCTPSPTPIEAKVSDLTASSPLIIKQTIDFPSDAFPCTLASSTLVKSISLSESPIPSPKLNPPSTKLSSTNLETILPKSTEPQMITEPTESNPLYQNTTGGNAVKGTYDWQETENKTSTFSSEYTNLQETDTAESCNSPTSSSVNKEDSEKANTSSVSEDDNSVSSQATTVTTVSPTQTYSEVSQELNPSTLFDDNKEQTLVMASPSLTPEPKSPLSRTDSSREKSYKKSAGIQTSEVRLAARYSRGESPCSRGNSARSTAEQSQTSKENTDPTPEILGVRQLRDFHQSAQDALRSSPDMVRSSKEGSNSPKSGSQSPHSGCDSPSKKMKRRKRR